MQILLVEMFSAILKEWQSLSSWEGQEPPVFIASFLRFLHCGRYPWLWNDEHVLVLPAVVGIGSLFCVLAMG